MTHDSTAIYTGGGGGAYLIGGSRVAATSRAKEGSETLCRCLRHNSSSSSSTLQQSSSNRLEELKKLKRVRLPFRPAPPPSTVPAYDASWCRLFQGKFTPPPFPFSVSVLTLAGRRGSLHFGGGGGGGGCDSAARPDPGPDVGR